MAKQIPVLFTLGSASPRRADLLASLELTFDVEAVAIDEESFVDPGEQNLGVIVERIARAKFAAFPEGSEHRLLLTADTLVACDGAVLGKPGAPGQVVSMLEYMSGRPLTIATAVCVGDRGAMPAIELVTTTVELQILTAAAIESYAATGVGMDKAGGLALQAEATPFIRSVRGCWSNVVGLPLCAVGRLLRPALEHTDLMTGARRAALGEGVCSIELCGRHDG